MKFFSKLRCAAVALAVLPALAQSQSEPLAQGHDKFLGGIFSPSQITNFESFFNQVTPENAGKWGAITNQATRPDEYQDGWFTGNWHGGLDNALDLAKDNDFPFRMHVLVWGNQQPSWIADLDEQEQRDAIEEWFDILAARYNDDPRGGFDYIEVVNEPVNDPPDQPDSNGQGGDYMDALGGAGDTGWDWVIEAFELARTYFPDAKLMVNEYNVISSNNVFTSYMELIEELQGKSLIDGIGVQAHAFSTRGTSVNDMKARLDQLAGTGLPVFVTEMDIDSPDGSERQQMLEYRRVFPVFWEHPGVEGVTLWGFMPGMWRTDQGAFLLDEDGNEKQAMHWLRCYLQCDQVTIIPNQEFSVSESASGGTNLGEVVTHSPSDSLSSWEITDGEGASQFEIASDGTLSLAGNASLDFASVSTHTLTVVAHDSQGSSEPETVVVNVSESTGNGSSGGTGSSSGGGADIPVKSSGGVFGGSLVLLLLVLLGGGYAGGRVRARLKP